MLICTFICTPFIPLDHHKQLSCYNNSSGYRSGSSDFLWINSRLLDVFTCMFRIIFFFSFGRGETEEISISNASCLEKEPSKCKPSIADPLPRDKQCRRMDTDNQTLALPVLSLVDHDPASVWKLCSHISMALCPPNLAWLINSDTALYCAMHSGWWAPKSMLTSSMNTWLSITISVVTSGP